MNFLQTDFLISALLIASAFIVFGLLILRLNNTSLPPVYPTPMPLQIGGWLIVIAALVILSLSAKFYKFFDLSIWVDGFWKVHFQNPGSSLAMSLLVLEALNVVFVLTFGFFSLILFFKRRDIAPKIMSYYFIISIAAQSLIDLVNIVTGYQTELPGNLSMRIFMIGLLKVAINILVVSLIIRYINRSPRAKATFVLPHPSLVDHEYPDFELNKES